MVTADGAPFIKDVVKKWCPNATIVMDNFHVMKWMISAMDDIRTELWQEARKELEKFRAKYTKEEIKDSYTLSAIDEEFEDEVRTLKKLRKIISICDESKLTRKNVKC